MLYRSRVKAAVEFCLSALLTIYCGRLHAQSVGQGGALHAGGESASTASLPVTSKIDEVISSLEAARAEVRRKALLPGFSTAHAAAIAATPEELVQKEQLLQQWGLALDQHTRHLRLLKEIRRVSLERAAEEEAWHGFVQPPTMLLAEQLTDLVSARRLELRSAQMSLSMFEGEIPRHAVRLSDCRKQLRLATDQSTGGTEDFRRQWIVQLGQLSVQTEEAVVEAAEVGRLVAWEAVNSLNANIQFLERKISLARAQAPFNKSDLQGMLAQIDAKRAALRKELSEAVAAEKQLRAAMDSPAGTNSPTETNVFVNAEWSNEVRNARLETSGHKVELLRGFLQISDFAQKILEDRFWATEPRGLKELQAKQRLHAEIMEKLGQWKRLIEQSLSAVSDQALRQAMRMEDTRLSSAERDAAREVHASLQERARIDLRAVGALALTEDLTVRLHAELSELITRGSPLGRFHSVIELVRHALLQVWGMELYIAEDSVIAGGQKVSIPRSITLGKVVIALTILLAGLLAARCVFRLVLRFSSEPSAKVLAAAIAIISLLLAMASVRIPWTIFAFMGGALAIGVGFGAQTLVNNFISGIILLGERTIRVGDIIEVDEQRGRIMKIGFRQSLLARGDGSEVIVPNSQFIEKKLVNWTLTDDLVRHSLSVTVAYGESTAEVARLISQAVAEHPSVAQDPAPQVLFDDFGEKALIFTLKFWTHLCPNIDSAKVASDLRHRITILLEQAGVAIFPSKSDQRLDGLRSVKFADESARAI